MGVLDFFGREAGQRRRAALDEFGRSAEQYVPPELRQIVGLLSDMTPNRANERAAMASDRLFQPDRTVGQRVGDFGEMASEIAGVVAPVAVAGRAGMPAAEALQEALMGFSAGSQQAGRAVVDRLNQPGPVPTMYSNPLMAPNARGLLNYDPKTVGSTGGNIRREPQAVDEADEITLFHGSPYDFRSFDTSQIGKGEGAQDLGRGFSLTDEEVVAHSYMNPASRWGDLEAMERYRQAGPGRTYQVGLKARPEQILDWKKPWKDQVPEGTPIYDKIQESMAKSYADDPEMQKLFQQANLSSVWRDDFGMEDAALKSGFVGNKRQNFSGDTEFTVFDPSKMEIKKVFDNEGRELPIAPSSPAQEVAGLLSSGRVDEVTDEMLGKLTPKDEMELFKLYQRGATGMDLPMGEASRMARAGEIGHNVERELYRGGGSDRKSFSADAGTFKTQNTGVFMDPNPMRAETYAKQGGGVVAPLFSRSDAPIVFGDMSEWNRLEAPSYAYDPVSDVDIPLIEQGVTTTTDDIARAARQRNLAAIEIQDVMDPGPMRWRNEDKSIREYPQFGATRVEFDPANIRSRFARFDPRLAHLRNLSAGVGGLGLLGMSYPQEEQY